VLQSVNDVVSSQGVKRLRFDGAVSGEGQDQGTVLPDSTFHVRGLNTRRVEPRNTPTVINAVFNRRNLWDGRADPIFNGVNEFGVRDPNAKIVNASNPIQPVLQAIRIEPASLASQAVGPPVSEVEMGFEGRPFAAIGRRLIDATPLAKQDVAWDDSVLGSFSYSLPGNPRKGLRLKYEQLIQLAFPVKYWYSTKIVEVTSAGSVFRDRPNRPLRTNEYTVMEYNFSLFFGLALQMYQATLVSDDAPIDRYFEGQTNALTQQQIQGLTLFDSDFLACAACHAGAEFTNASTRIILGANGEPGEVIERMLNGQCEVVIYDQSFYNIGVRPTAEDLGIGANDPYGNPLSIARLLTMPASAVPTQALLGINYPNIANPPPQLNERTSAMGAFKVPSLRNVELTAPYFHNGGHRTLREAIQFYNRGGDFRDQNVQFIDFEIGKLNLTDTEIDALVAFLRSLTDPRVVNQQAPFDHPQILVPNGHTGNQSQVVADSQGTAQDQLLNVPAVGRNGGPLPKGFLEP
jgi:cytochrome c peroxidase